jgi:hypothetical protein
MGKFNTKFLSTDIFKQANQIKILHRFAILESLENDSKSDEIYSNNAG